MNPTTAIIPGSLQALANQTHSSIAETFLSCDLVVIVDTSGSMIDQDGTGKSRYDRACDELKAIQQNMPGKIAVIAFSDEVSFCPSGIPKYFGGSTDLVKALKFSKVADIPSMRFILISDGMPDEPQQSLSIAGTYKNHIDVIYIGPEDGSGRDYLAKLAAASGGHSVSTVAEQIESQIKALLNDGR